MAICNPNEIKPRLAKNQRILGLDLGTKTIGLALSDVGHIIASPLLTIKRSKFSRDAEILEGLIEEHSVGALIFGLPVQMDGTEGPRAQATRSFAQEFINRHDIAVAFWDERLSTAAVERMLIKEADISRKKRSAAVDKAAAAYILQGALDSL